MNYKIELRYLFGWEGAGWTEADDRGERPLRFNDRFAAQTALAEFFAEVRTAVRNGDMDIGASPDDYRIVEVLR